MVGLVRIGAHVVTRVGANDDATRGAAVSLLALDTATPLSGVAVGNPTARDEPGGTFVVALRRARVTTHSETLLPLIAECLAELGMSPRELSGVACGAGPGSFTGLRIGAATAKGMCFALGVPLMMVSSLEVLAARAGDRMVLSCIDAGRGQVYARLFPGAAAAVPLALPADLLMEAQWDPAQLVERLGQLSKTLPEQGAPLLLVGDGALRHRQMFETLAALAATVLDEDPAPHPLDLLRLGAALLSRGEHDDLAGAVPNYICLSAAERNATPMPMPIEAATPGRPA